MKMTSVHAAVLLAAVMAFSGCATHRAAQCDGKQTKPMQKERLVFMSTLTTGPVGGVGKNPVSLGNPNASGQIKVVANHPEYHTKWCVYQSSPSGVTRRLALEPMQAENPPVNPVTLNTEGRWYVMLEADPGVSFYPGSNPVEVDVRKNVKTKIKVTY